MLPGEGAAQYLFVQSGGAPDCPPHSHRLSHPAPPGCYLLRHARRHQNSLSDMPPAGGTSLPIGRIGASWPCSGGAGRIPGCEAGPRRVQGVSSHRPGGRSSVRIRLGRGGKGCGGYYGAQYIQGLCAHYYDFVRTRTAIELDRCMYNAMAESLYATGKSYYEWKLCDKRYKCEY